MKRSAIALMITLLFVISISVAIGIGLKQVKEASQSVQSEAFMIESSIILDDVLRLLQTNKDLDLITKAEAVADRRDALGAFLASSAFIPFESSGVKVVLEIKSARAKFNLNMLVDEESHPDTQRVDALATYLATKNVESNYVDFLLDDMSGIKEDGDYKTELFIEDPTLFRDYISTSKQLEKINDIYAKMSHTDVLQKVDFKHLFCYSKDRNNSIDLNYAPKEVWSMILGVDEQRAEQLYEEEGSYASLDDLALKENEVAALQRFQTSFYEPFLDVKVEILKGDEDVKIEFEYDLKKKKGSHFIYEL